MVSVVMRRFRSPGTAKTTEGPQDSEAAQNTGDESDEARLSEVRSDLNISLDTLEISVPQ